MYIYLLLIEKKKNLFLYKHKFLSLIRTLTLLINVVTSSLPPSFFRQDLFRMFCWVKFTFICPAVHCLNVLPDYSIKSNNRGKHFAEKIQQSGI